MAMPGYNLDEPLEKAFIAISQRNEKWSLMGKKQIERISKVSFSNSFHSVMMMENIFYCRVWVFWKSSLINAAMFLTKKTFH